MTQECRSRAGSASLLMSGAWSAEMGVGTAMTKTNMRRAFRTLCRNAGFGDDWTTYELRHSFVSVVSDQLDDLVKVADLAGHVDTRTTEGYRHSVRPSLPHAAEAWERLLASDQHGAVASGLKRDERAIGE